MKISATIYNCPVIRLIRDPEFPDLLEIRLGEGRWADTIKIWSEDDKPVCIIDETGEKHENSNVLAFAGREDSDHS